MKFTEKCSIFLEKDFSSKDELFEFLSNKSKELNICNDKEKVKIGLYDREKDGHTVIADMIAMPHCRIEEVNELRIIIVSLKKPIVYTEDESIDLAYSIISPLACNDEFIDHLMQIAIIAQDDEFAKQLKNSKIGEEKKIISMIEDILKLHNEI